MIKKLKKTKKLIALAALTAIVATLSGCYYDDKAVAHGIERNYNDGSLNINIKEAVYVSNNNDATNHSTAYWMATIKDYSGNRINAAIGQDTVGSKEDVLSMGNRLKAVFAINASSWDSDETENEVSSTAIYKQGNAVNVVPGKVIYGNTLTLDNKGFLDFPAYYTNLANRYYDSSAEAKNLYGISADVIASTNSGAKDSSKLSVTENYLQSRTTFPVGYVTATSLKNKGVVANFNFVACPLYVNRKSINLSNITYPTGNWKGNLAGIYYNRHPRTAIAQTLKKGENGADHNEYIVLVSDGRNTPIFDGSTTDKTQIKKFSEGLTIPEVQNILSTTASANKTSVITGYNLDGGGSSQLYFQGHILNHTCGDPDNTKTDTDDGSLRPVMDSIYFK